MSILMKAVVRNLAHFKFRIHLTVATTPNIQRTTRCFSVDSRLCKKMFMEHENRYAYDIMQNKGYAMDIEIPKESTTLNEKSFQDLLGEDWVKKSPSQIFEAFTQLSAYCSENNICISNTMFDNFIDIFTDNLNKATDTELVSMFYALNMWPETKSIRTRNFIEVWAALDDACFQRANMWSSDETLTFMALFFMLNVSKVSDFCRKGLNKLAARAKGLTATQLVRTLFFVGIQRKPPYDMHNLEIYLGNNLSEFTVDELAIMSMGFFKSKTPIRDEELVKKIIVKLIENVKSIHEVSLAALLKIIRYSMKMPFDHCIAMVYELLNVLTPEVPRLSIMCNVHIALLGTSKLILHEACLDAVAENTLKNISKTRLKDLERMALTYGTLHYLPKKQAGFVDKIIEELRNPERETEIQNHGRTFACCVAFLGLLGKFPADLISKVLREDFLQQAYGNQVFAYGKEILVLNNTAQLFCTGHEINRLSSKDLKTLANKYTDYVPSEEFKKQYNVSEKMVLDVIKILKELRGGSQFFAGDHILSHHQRGDLIICNSPEGKPLPVSMDSFSGFGSIRRPPDGNKWIVLIITGRNGTLYGTRTPTGPIQLKIKELQKLGYCVNLVLWNDYTTLKSVEDKTEYLENIIETAT